MLTEERVAEQVYNLLKVQGAQVGAMTEVRAMGLIPAGLAVLGERVAAGEAWRSLLKTFEGNVTDGYVDLSAGAFDGLLLDLERAVVEVTPSGSTAAACFVVPDTAIGSTRLPSDAAYVAAEGNRLKVRKAGLTTFAAFNGTVSIRAGFIPTLAQVPVEHEQTLVLIVAELAGGPGYVETKDAAERKAQAGEIKKR
jgi:hypothetical protein